ncbi:glycosyltransferase family 29 protein, partial [Phaeovulum sp.]|uniref:glycosyltransferase family 29 protein n=1 Tax=Phaeovulum sp. TaxID=2934796 RepID=UPI003566E73D
ETQDRLMEELQSKHVALVGNARALANTSHGAAIEAAELVVRINSAPIVSSISHGTRTDWLGVSVPPDQATLAARAPRHVLWMTRKRKRLPYALAHRPGFYLHPKADSARLRALLGAPPTTGLMLIDLLSRAPLASLTLYGFDFFASLSLSGRRNAQQVPHDFGAEASFVADLIARDSRITRVE